MTIRRSNRTLTRAVFAAALALGVVATGAAVLPGQAAYAQSTRDAGAEQFVQAEAQKVISVLGNKGMSTAAKATTFRGLIDQIADVPRISNFVLGKYSRTITPAQRQKFNTVFRIYAQNVYETRLNDYSGETVKVTGSIVKKPGDVIVNTTVGGGQLKQPIPVAWRVIGGGSSWKVVDVQVKGIWLAITQQQDFVSTIDNAGGNVDVLINQLQQRNQSR